MPDFSTLLDSLNIVDYGVIALLALSGIIATSRGLMREILGLMGWVLAIMLATLLQPMIAGVIIAILGHETASRITAFMAIFIFVAVMCYPAANIIAPGLRNITFGMLDPTLGFVFGLLRGAVLAVLIYMAALLAYGDEDNLPRLVRDSASIEYARKGAHLLAGLARGELRRELDNSLPDAIPRPQGTLEADEIIPRP